MYISCSLHFILRNSLQESEPAVRTHLARRGLKLFVMHLSTIRTNNSNCRATSPTQFSTAWSAIATAQSIHTQTQTPTPSTAFQHFPPKEGCRKPVLGMCTKVDPGEKIPCCTGDSNPRQYCARLFKHMEEFLNIWRTKNF